MLPIQYRLSGVLAAQKKAHALHPYPSRRERIDRLDRLRAMLDLYRERLTAAVEQDFGSRSPIVTVIADTMIVRRAIAHARRHLGEWMAARPVATGILFAPSRGAWSVSPSARSASSARGTTRSNERDRPLASYWFGRSSNDRRKILERTVSGAVTINGTLLHIAQENIPFGGVGPSGQGHYDGEAGFRRFSKEKGVFFESRISAMRLLYPPIEVPPRAGCGGSIAGRSTAERAPACEGGTCVG